MKPEFYSYKKLYGTGSSLVIEFIKYLQDEFCARIKRYALYRGLDREFEHLFYYGEQQTKTYISGLLDKICDTNFMQETQVKRRTNKFKKKREILRNGRLDYWCRYGDVTKISILMEIKQSWIRYYDPHEWTIYEDVTNKHQTAINQLLDIENKRDYTVDNLYGLALTILPIYTRYPNKNSPRVKLTTKIIESIANKAMQIANADAFGSWIIPDAYCPIDTWYESENSIKKNENHPGIIFLWSIKKFTKG